MMAHPTLADTLRRKADDDVEAVWRQARADADRRGAERERAAAARRATAAQELADGKTRLLREAAAGAEDQARTIRAAAKAALADRLHRMAVEALPQFRDEAYAARFAALAAELPTRPWQRVTVNPADEALARRHFPCAQVACDPAIVGGMDVDMEDGRVRVSNTLEARLATAWPEILPGLMKDVLEALSRS